MLNESSSEEEIISYIEKDSLGFLWLCSFHDVPWAQPYLDKAAELAAEGESYSFLYHFHDKPWSKPYLDKAAELAAEGGELFLSPPLSRQTLGTASSR